MQAGNWAGMQSWGLFFRFALAGGCSVAAVVGVSSENCTCAIKLLGGDEPCEFVSHCDGAKRELKLSVRARSFGPAVGRSDGADEVLRAGVAPSTEPGGELLGAERAPATVGQSKCGGGAGVLARKPGEKLILSPEKLGARGVVGLDALDVKGCERLKRGLCSGALGARANVGEGDLHGRLSVRRVACRVCEDMERCDSIDCAHRVRNRFCTGKCASRIVRMECPS